MLDNMSVDLNPFINYIEIIFHFTENHLLKFYKLIDFI